MKEFFKINVRLISALIIMLIAFNFSNCSKDDPEPSTGKITGKVTDLSTKSALAEVTVIAFDAVTNSPVNTTKTNSSGDYTFDVSGGNYFLKFYKQGYVSVPPPGMDAIPFEVVVGQTTTQGAELTASSVSNAGSISGKVSVGTSGKSGVLVVAETTGAAFSAVSDKDGNYTIFNTPAGTYNVKAYVASFSAAAVSTNVTANTATENVNITLAQGATGQFTGTFKVISQTTIATQPTSMDISLVHPLTKETIPGLSQSLAYFSSLSFSFNNIPDGTYIVRATYANDYIVIDPDYIKKFGDYKVTISGGTASPATIDIVATSAVTVTSPSNAMSTTVPVDATATPTFQWSAYPSTSDYVIEVTDASTGTIVWGGFTNTNGTLTKNITIASNTTSVTYNSDGKASAPLTVGKVYRWRVYASKNNNQTGGWNLISASEDQMGLIKIK